MMQNTGKYKNKWKHGHEMAQYIIFIVNTLSANPAKMLKHTQIICRRIV